MWRGYFLGMALLALDWEMIKGECPGTESCRPKTRCVLLSNELESSECDLPPDGKGFCCEDVIGKRRVGLSNRENRPPTKISLRRPEGILDTDVEKALRDVPEVSTSSRKTGSHNFFTQPRKGNDDILNSAQKLLFAKDIGIGERDSSIGLNSVNSNAIKEGCIWEHSRKPDCGQVPKSRDGEREYRTIDGSCNNKFQPLYGMAGTPLQRIIEPGDYKPFEGLPRKATGGGELPSARLVSNVVFNEGTETDGDFTHLLMQIGQFLDHDLTHVPAFSGNEDGSSCCNGPKQFEFPSGIQDTNRCFPIEVPIHDPVWGVTGTRSDRRTCMEFGRSMFAPTLECRAGAREQENDLTHWIDMSMIYGSSEAESEKLRNSEERHLLLVTSTINSRRLTPARSLLPQCLTQSPAEQRLLDNEERESVEICEQCERNEHININNCFFSGDIRTNEQPGLTTMHTIWVREHNRIAEALLVLFRHLTKDEIFFEARRIVMAEWQHIIYQEWLPIILGKNYMETFEMLPLSFGYSTKYNPDIDPRINNEFAAAAFRFGHSLIYTEIPLRDSSNRKQRGVDLKSVFDDASNLNEASFVDKTVRGMAGDGMPALDADFAEDILHNMFENDLDLPALNIQRARDHGVPGYNKYRGECQSTVNRFGAVRSIDELSRDGRISQDAVNKLKQIYDHVDDIDLFVGGILEFFGPHDDALLGPTFLCIIGDQFRRLKEGDRFWYENGQDSKTRFSLQQLNEIRNKASMARILCDNSRIGSIQPLPFRRVGRGNSRVLCSDTVTIPRLDLTAFV